MDNEHDDDIDELSDEEEPRTQRFDVTVIWPTESDQHIDQGELKTVINDAIMELDSDAVVDVTEIDEPTF